MSETPMTPDQLPTRVDADADRALIETDPDLSGEVTFTPLYANPQEKVQFAGEALHRDTLAMMRRYPVSHASNLTQVLNATRTGHEPAPPEDWLQGEAQLADDEVMRLGERRLSNPVLSIARIPKEDIAMLAVLEPDRQQLARWLVEAADDPLISRIDTIELRLFNDTTELTVGESSGTGDQASSRWAIRFEQYSDEKFTQLQDRLARLGELVPPTHLIRKDEQALALTEWSPGEHVSAAECDEFVELVRSKGVDPDDFDIHGENIMRQPDGRLVYVDSDYLYVR